MSLCPCGSTQTYEHCCAMFIEKKQRPQTPEQLMRSRYTAYSQANIDYIKNTMKGKPLIGFNETEAKEWAQRVIWMGLTVIQSYEDSPHKGFVEFKAQFKENNQLKKIHELSEFHRVQDTWYYVEGINKKSSAAMKKQTIARNSPCPCGSGKKFKNCHDK